MKSINLQGQFEDKQFESNRMTTSTSKIAKQLINLKTVKVIYGANVQWL